MAVDTHERRDPTPMVRDYWPRLLQRISLLALIPTVCLMLVVGGLLIALDISHTSAQFWGMIAIIGVLTYGSIGVIASITSKPLRAVLTLLSRSAGEPNSEVLPSPNQAIYKGTGLDTALQMLYEISSQTADPRPGTSASQVATQDDAPLDVAPALDQMDGSVVILDHDGAIIFASAHAPVQTVAGKTELHLLFNGSDSLDAWLEEREESSVKAEHIWHRVPDRPSDQGDQRIYDVHATYEKGARFETVLLLVDQTEFYRQDEDNLNFIAFAAHELRGPITVVRGYIDVLQDELDDHLSKEQRELFRRLTVSSNRLSGYINNILNTSRYDQRHLSVQLSEDSVAKIYDTIRDDMALRASLQNRILNIDIPTTLPTIAADRASLSEVFGNLIDNAIKYSSEGGVVTVSAEKKGEFVEIHVRDRGIGMPANVVSNLFQKFYRSHRSRETVAGSGIGLYISKAIVESHGGTISVRSAEGEGSTFVVSVPTYASVADKLRGKSGNNAELIQQGSGWIKNHSMYRG